VHLAYMWIVSHPSAKNYRNLWKYDEVLTKTNLLSFFGTRCSNSKFVPAFVCGGAMLSVLLHDSFSVVVHRISGLCSLI